MKKLRVVADENIPFVNEVFGPLGDVMTYPGRTLSAEQVREADVLLVRSVTPVSPRLLQGSKVRFVGTCTIGIDHLDVSWLGQQGIHWVSAPGCNANSVVQYVLSAMAVMRPQWLQLSVGIVGCGNVGGRLFSKLQALGVNVRCCDPWLTQESNSALVSLDDVLSSDIVCLHTPLIEGGQHPTWHLLDEARLGGLPDGALLISAGRGAVVDNQALKRVLQQRQDLDVVLDVWEPEPLLDVELMNMVALATPHIAGYSFDGKVAGTLQVYQSLCDFLGVEPSVTASGLLQGDESSCQRIDADVWDLPEWTAAACLNRILLHTYDITADSERTHKLLGGLMGRDEQRAIAFDQLRKAYPKRREYGAFQLAGQLEKLSPKEKKSLNTQLATLGISRTKQGEKQLNKIKG